MLKIRPLIPSDVPAVVSLWEYERRSGSRDVPQSMIQYFSSIYCNDPWAESDIPSLVAIQDGELVGFIGALTRRYCLNGQPIRVACCGPLIIDHEKARELIGVFLLKKFFTGPQDVTITDGANERVQSIWEKLGGETAHLQSIRWTRFFRPLSAATETSFESQHILKSISEISARFVDNLGSKLYPFRLKSTRFDSTLGPLDSKILLSNYDLVKKATALQPAYDLNFLNWIFGELKQVKGRGQIQAFLVRDAKQSVLGWFIYFLKPWGISRVLQLVSQKGAEENVMQHLFEHAYSGKAAALVGRMKPGLMSATANMRCFLHQRGSLLLVHSSNKEILQHIARGNTLMSRLEGESWTRLVDDTFPN